MESSGSPFPPSQWSRLSKKSFLETGEHDHAHPLPPLPTSSTLGSEPPAQRVYSLFFLLIFWGNQGRKKALQIPNKGILQDINKMYIARKQTIGFLSRVASQYNEHFCVGSSVLTLEFLLQYPIVLHSAQMFRDLGSSKHRAISFIQRIRFLSARFPFAKNELLLPKLVLKVFLYLFAGNKHF